VNLYSESYAQPDPSIAQLLGPVNTSVPVTRSIWVSHVQENGGAGATYPFGITEVYFSVGSSPEGEVWAVNLSVTYLGTDDPPPEIIEFLNYNVYYLYQ
jgi:hypothetical protein